MGTKDHDQGQTDASNGDYSPPNSLGEEMKSFCGMGANSYSDTLAENADYRDGHAHTSSQK